MTINGPVADWVDRLACTALVVAALLLASCQSGAVAPSAAVPAIATPTTAVAASTPPPVTQAGPAAPAPSGTSQPTVTLAPTSTPQAPALQPITVASAPQVVLLDRLGTGPLQDIAWLPDGHTLVAAFYSRLSLHDATSLGEGRLIPAYGLKAGLAASPDGRHVALIAGDGVQLWDVSAGQLVYTLVAAAGR